MSANARIEIVGVKETLKTLGKIDKELRKQFNRDAKKIAEPVIAEARNIYPKVQPVSGMARNWKVNGRQLFPFNPNKARSGLRVKISTAKKTENVIAVEQRDVATAVFETIGTKSGGNALFASLDKVSSRFPGMVGNPQRYEKRVLSPAADSKAGEVSREMEKLVLTVSNRIQRELN